MTAPEPAGTPDSRSGTVPAGQAGALIICPPPEPRQPMSGHARASADYALEAARRGVVSMDDALKLRLVQRRLSELGASQ